MTGMGHLSKTGMVGILLRLVIATPTEAMRHVILLLIPMEDIRRHLLGLLLETTLRIQHRQVPTTAVVADHISPIRLQMDLGSHLCDSPSVYSAIYP